MSTKRFLLQKILQLILTLFLVTAITFILMQLSPIDAAEAYSRRIFTVDETRIEAVREQMGLNRPIVVQYLDWLNDLLHFDLGNSYVDNRDVFLIVGSALKETACIVLLSAVLQAVGALILGILLYLTRKNVIGKILAFASIAAISIPAFYLATSFIDVVAVRWNLISVSGNTGLMRYLPAALCLAVGGICFFRANAFKGDSAGHERGQCSLRPLQGVKRSLHCSAVRYAPGYHLYGSDIYADDGNVYGGVRHSRKHFFSARIGVSDCKQPDKS